MVLVGAAAWQRGAPEARGERSEQHEERRDAVLGAEARRLRRVCSVPALPSVPVRRGTSRCRRERLSAPRRPTPTRDPAHGSNHTELSHALYAGVGSRWLWTDRLDWSWARWHEYLARAEVETWVAWVRGTPAGYAEIEHAGDAVELVSFGLLPAFFGRGYGPRLLDAVVRRAWARGPRGGLTHARSTGRPPAHLPERGVELYDEAQARATFLTRAERGRGRPQAP